MENAEKIGISELKPAVSPDRRVSVAPMMDYTDRHCRYFMRLLSPSALLYTEMITSAALVRGHATRLLEYTRAESKRSIADLRSQALDGGDLVRALQRVAHDAWVTRPGSTHRPGST